MGTDDEVDETDLDPDSVLADLDADQRAAVTTDSRLVAVVAGAGSGKTRVLTRRVAHRIATADADPRHTLVLTFTREAAGELRRRLRRLGLTTPVEAGTFHSVMLAVLRQRWADTDRGPRSVLSDRRGYVREVAKGLGESRRGVVESAISEIDWAMARGIRPDRYAPAIRRASRRSPNDVDRITEIFDAYQTLKRRRGVIDFDDVLLLTLDEAERDREFADVLRWRFRHLLVDEAQDLNPVQHRIVDLLRHGRDDLFLVGDPSQAIFGFNGADPRLLIDVAEHFPGVEVLRLPVNHRCTPQVVHVGRHVLEAAAQPAEIRSSRPDGPLATTVSAADADAEAGSIASTIAAGSPDLVRSGQVAVLARTNPQLAVIEQALEGAGVKVRRRADRVGTPLERAVRTAASMRSAAELRTWSHDVLDDVAALDSLVGGELVAFEAERRVAAAALDYLRDHPLGSGPGLRQWIAATAPFDDGEPGGVEVLTFHAAKGREWHTVYVTGVETSLVPHRSATSLDERAEEGRLLYVACTRATDRLVLTRADRRGGYQRRVSPFLEDLDLTEQAPAPPPRELLRQMRERRTTPPSLERLRAWRSDVARRTGALPEHICSDRDLASIASERPRNADELAAVTSMGPITAARLADTVVEVLDAD
ncbi:MAG: UvrD-helicase domain-containing protein [Actinomycetota bacterium]